MWKCSFASGGARHPGGLHHNWDCGQKHTLESAPFHKKQESCFEEYFLFSFGSLPSDKVIACSLQNLKNALEKKGTNAVYKHVST